MTTTPVSTQTGSGKGKGGVKRKGSGAQDTTHLKPGYVFLLSLCRQMGWNGWELETCHISSPLVCFLLFIKLFLLY